MNSKCLISLLMLTSMLNLNIFQPNLPQCTSVQSKPVISASSKSSTPTLDKERIIKDQSFQVKLNNFGKVRFVSYQPGREIDLEDVSFFLTKNNKVIYSFPYYYKHNSSTYYGMYDSMEAVAFKDINHDHLKDVIVIINYVLGAGPQGMIPRPKARIFLGQTKGFKLDRALTDEINDKIPETNLTIKRITKYLESK